MVALVLPSVLPALQLAIELVDEFVDHVVRFIAVGRCDDIRSADLDLRRAGIVVFGAELLILMETDVDPNDVVVVS